jgi:hypothetical protein
MAGAGAGHSQVGRLRQSPASRHAWSRAPTTLAGPTELAGNVPQLGEHLLSTGDEAVTSLGERHRAGDPVEEVDTELALQGADLLAHRGLDDVKAFGRSSEVQLVGDRQEVLQLAGLEHPRNLLLSLISAVAICSLIRWCTRRSLRRGTGAWRIDMTQQRGAVLITRGDRVGRIRHLDPPRATATVYLAQKGEAARR